MVKVDPIVSPLTFHSAWLVGAFARLLLRACHQCCGCFTFFVFQSCGIEKEVLYEKNGSDEFIDSRANKYRCIAHNQDDL